MLRTAVVSSTVAKTRPWPCERMASPKAEPAFGSTENSATNFPAGVNSSSVGSRFQVLSGVLPWAIDPAYAERLWECQRADDRRKVYELSASECGCCVHFARFCGTSSVCGEEPTPRDCLLSRF